MYIVLRIDHPFKFYTNQELTHSLIYLSTPAGTFPCRRPRCRTCDFTGRTATITNANGGVRVKVRFNCTATGVVYVITCQHCYKLYIGETGQRLADRFGEHLRSVEVFKLKPFYQGEGYPLLSTLIYLNITKSTS